MRRIVLTDLALEDLSSVWAYIARDDPAAATRMLERIDSRVRLLSRFPELGEVDDRISHRCRRIIVGSYLVFYNFDDQAVRVLRVFHASRRIDDLNLSE